MNLFTSYQVLHPHPAPKTPAEAAALKKHNKLVHTTQQWVSQSFYGTLLKQMRQDPFHSDVMDGGRGGQVFYELFDQQLAQRMARGAPNSLVNSIVSKIEHGKASASYLRHSLKSGATSTQARFHVTLPG